MYKIEIINEIDRVKNLMQEIEFKALFYNQPLSTELQLTYAQYQGLLSKLHEELNIINKA